MTPQIYVSAFGTRDMFTCFVMMGKGKDVIMNKRVVSHRRSTDMPEQKGGRQSHFCSWSWVYTYLLQRRSLTAST